MSMHAQPGIFAFGTIEHCYVEFDLTPGRDPVELGAALAGLHGPDTPLVATSAVVGLRPELWASIAPDATPPGVRSFAPIEAGDYSMPATQQDAWIWLAGASRDSVFDSTLAAIRLLDGLASVATDVSGFGYRRNRDLTGFIDGTENPSAAEAPAVAVVADGPAAGAGVLLVQQWEHLSSFATLSTEPASLDPRQPTLLRGCGLLRGLLRGSSSHHRCVHRDRCPRNRQADYVVHTHALNGAL
jgi:putative iron-dependent peroxidase